MDTQVMLLQVECPDCQSRVGMLCSRPTDEGRALVTWVHAARRDAAADAAVERAKATRGAEVKAPPEFEECAVGISLVGTDLVVCVRAGATRAQALAMLRSGTLSPEALSWVERSMVDGAGS